METRIYQAGTGYRRLPRTILITMLASLLLVTSVAQIRQLRVRQTDYLKLVTRFDGLSGRYAQQSQSDSEVAQLATEDVLNLEDLARKALSDGDTQLAASLTRMAENKRREAERLQAQARRWAEVEKYYASLRQRYNYAASHPWWTAPFPSGDPLDVEGVFLSGQTP